MCGILCYLGSEIPLSQLQKSLKTLKHRGPDDSRLISRHDNSFFLSFGFTRLAIIDPSSAGMQPMILNDVILICNGEIYNCYRDLIQEYGIEMKSGSDCEVLLHLYIIFGRGSEAIDKLCRLLDAEFAFALYDLQLSTLFVGRDFGIRPLFLLQEDTGSWFALEPLALMSFVNHGKIRPFQPRSWWSSQYPYEFQTYYSFPRDVLNSTSVEFRLLIRETLISSVKKRLMSDRPYGFFLSGGLDSSLIVSIASQLTSTKLRTFSIGLDSGSPDLDAAKVVSEFSNADHTEIRFSFENVLRVLDEVIKSDATFDTTTIRASIPQYLLSEYISKRTDIRVLLSGEGSDELSMGYRDCHNAPSNDALKDASVDLCENLYMYDCLRVDRTTAAHGLEVRVPFLLYSYIDLMMKIPPEYRSPLTYGTYGQKKKNCEILEKWIVREAFEGYLPFEILYRTKAAFSDAVGLQHVEALKEYAEEKDFR